jgi:hypothetical protein
MTTGEQVGAAVDAAVQQSQADAQAQIDAAKADADAAARQAKAIADAALATELGARIETTQQEFRTWQTAADQRLTDVAERQKVSEAQLAEATTLLGSIRALLTPAQPPKPEAPPSDQGTGQTGVNSTKTEQSEKPKVQAEQQPQAPPRRRRFL